MKSRSGRFRILSLGAGRSAALKPNGCFMADTQKVFGKVHVNLVDLINVRRTGERLQKFPSVQALRSYTLETPEKVFPKQAAKQDGFLKALLRELFKT